MRPSSISPFASNGVTSAVAHPRSQSSFIVISFLADYLVEDFREFIEPFASDDPFCSHQGAGGKALARSGFVRDANLIRCRIKTEPVRAGNVTRARRRDRYLAAKTLFGYLLEL